MHVAGWLHWAMWVDSGQSVAVASRVFSCNLLHGGVALVVAQEVAVSCEPSAISRLFESGKSHSSSAPNRFG